MSDSRRIGYGFNRKPSDFYAAKLDGVFLDTDGTDRDELRMLLSVGVRAGDTLVLIKISDLGAGRGLQNLRRALEGMGVNVEIFEPEPEPKRPIGRPEKGGLSDEDWGRFEKLWHDPVTDGGYILTKACEAMGEDGTEKKARERVRLRLNRKFGPRIKPVNTEGQGGG